MPNNTHIIKVLSYLKTVEYYFLWHTLQVDTQLFHFLILLKIWIPQIFVQIDVAVFVHFDAVSAQKSRLRIRAAKSKCRGAFAKAIDHSKTRDMFGIGIEMQGIAHRSRCAR